MVMATLPAASGESRANERAHFLCEQAQECLDRGQRDEALELLERALLTDRRSVRASLMSANQAFLVRDLERAIQHLKRVEQQDIDFLPEALPLLVRSYRALERQQELREYLTEEKMKLYAMKGVVHKAEQQLSTLRKYRGIIANDPQMPPDLKREKTDEILRQEKELLIAYNLPKLRGMAGL